MIECPLCHTELPDGTEFCDQCELSLLNGALKRTNSLWAKSELALAMTASPERKATASGVPMTLSVTVMDSGRKIELPLTNPIEIGRGDESRDIISVIDLSANGGQKMGVSRHHARIVRRGSKVFVQDLNSSNGTFLNMKRLEPHRLYELRDGDWLHVGILGLSISILREE